MKWLFSFSLILLLIFPLFNSPKMSLFETDGIKQIYLADEVNGNFDYVLQEKDDIKVDEFIKSDAVLLVFSEKNIEKIVKNLKIDVVKEEQLENENMKIYYGFTPFYNNYIYINDKQCNVQIVQKNDEIIAGFPIIYCGY